MWCWRPAQIGPPQTHMRLWRWPYARRWSESVDLPLVLSQTKLNWSLAVVEEVVDSVTHNMVTQCGAGGQPKLDLIESLADLVFSDGDVYSDTCSICLLCMLVNLKFYL